jgi:hypothetical protein
MTAFKRPAFPLTGGCTCGAVRYEVTAMPLLLYACHCTECQRRSGSAFALNMPVATESFRIVKGTPKGWRNAGQSGPATTAWFCGDCGGRVYGEWSGRPESKTIRAGTLDDTSWLRPAAHFFMRSAQPWESISEDALCFETDAKDLAPVAAAWQAMWAKA